MKERVIANPPIGIYTNKKTHIGHAFFLIFLDSIARYKQKFKGEKIIFPGRSYNFYGKRGDKLFDQNISSYDLHSELDKLNLETILKDKNRLKLNLSSLDLLIDNEKEITEGVTSDFIKLNEKKYLINKGEDFFLDCKKISKENNLKDYLKKIHFFPERTEKIFRFLIKNNTDLPVQITRSTRYSLTNPFGEKNIGPLFVLANLWNHKYGNVAFSMAGSKGVLTKYVFLRFLSQIALNKDPGMDEVIMWPKMIPEKGNLNLSSLTKNGFERDILRYSLLSSYSNKHQKIFLPQSNFIKSKNFIYRVSNLRKALPDKISKEKKDLELLKNYMKEMDLLNYKKVFYIIEKEMNSISKKINLKKDLQVWNNYSRKQILLKYSSYLEMLEPFIPYTYNKLVTDNNEFKI